MQTEPSRAQFSKCKLTSDIQNTGTECMGEKKQTKLRTPSVSQSWFICTDTSRPDGENKACTRLSHWHQQHLNASTLDIGGNTQIQVWACSAIRRVTFRREKDLDERDAGSRSAANQNLNFSSFLYFSGWEGVRPWLLLLWRGSGRKGNLTDADWAEQRERCGRSMQRFRSY